jgi:hypothetical protein
MFVICFGGNNCFYIICDSTTTSPCINGQLTIELLSRVSHSDGMNLIHTAASLFSNARTSATILALIL